MSKGAETRKTILREALAQASRLGLEGLSIGTLAKEVGLSKSGLYAHFDSKEDLLIGVLEAAAASFVEIVVGPALAKPRGEARVRALFDNWLKWEKSVFLPGGCVFISTANELDDRPGPVRDRLVAYQKEWLNTIARTASVAVELGQFRGDLDVQQFAYDAYAVLLAYHHFGRLIRDPDAGSRARLSFENLLEVSKA
ncbi:MAG: TetR/AcrR family transcriptional regulator [Acidobacteriota bacterium]